MPKPSIKDIDYLDLLEKIRNFDIVRKAEIVSAIGMTELSDSRLNLVISRFNSTFKRYHLRKMRNSWEYVLDDFRRNHEYH